MIREIDLGQCRRGDISPREIRSLDVRIDLIAMARSLIAVLDLMRFCRLLQGLAMTDQPIEGVREIDLGIRLLSKQLNQCLD
jgi:hypothetical protein